MCPPGCLKIVVVVKSNSGLMGRLCSHLAICTTFVSSRQAHRQVHTVLTAGHMKAPTFGHSWPHLPMACSCRSSRLSAAHSAGVAQMRSTYARCAELVEQLEENTGGGGLGAEEQLRIGLPDLQGTKVLSFATICLQLGHPVHLLHGAGHWVHTDNPGEVKLPEKA